MKTGYIDKRIKAGNSLAVRIPKEFRFEGSEVEIFKRGDEILLKQRPNNLEAVFDLLAEMSDDFMSDGRDDSLPQIREEF